MNSIFKFIKKSFVKYKTVHKYRVYTKEIKDIDKVPVRFVD